VSNHILRISALRYYSIISYIFSNVESIYDKLKPQHFAGEGGHGNNTADNEETEIMKIAYT